MFQVKKLRIILLILLGINVFPAFAQVEPFHLYGPENTTIMPVFKPITTFHDKKEGSLRFAHPFFVNLTPYNSGSWTNLEDGCRIWTLAIHSEGAQSLNIIFDNFKIDPNSRIILYSPYYEHPKITLTNNDQTPTGVLPTVPIPGDLLVVEYQQYRNCKSDPDIVIGAVNHDYTGIFGHLNSNKVGRFGDAGACNPNVTCATDSALLAESKAVCKIIVDGTELCSGTLLNNTAGDGTPYFLSAAHCFRRNESPSSTIFIFNYEVPGCQSNIEGNKLQYITGATIKTFVDTLDVALLQMNKIPDHQFQPYWAGWSIETTTKAPLYAIHHPLGDVKKYATTTDPLVNATFNSYTNSGMPFSTNAHWQVKTWNTGTTQGGSSGCGIFDANNRLVGSLSGGEASCNNPRNDYFMRLNRAWKAGSAPNEQLACWLNPNNQSISGIGGMNYYQSRMERYSFINAGSTPSAIRHKGFGTGFVAGHNSWHHTAFAQYFDNIRKAKIKGVYLVSGKSVNYSDQTFSIHLWRDDNGLPGQTIASIENIAVSSLTNNAETLYEFANAIEVKEPIHVGIEISYQQTAIDSVAILVNKGTIGLDKNRFSIFEGDQWKPFTDLSVSNQPSSLWVDILASELSVGEVPTPSTKNDLLLYPQKVTNGFTAVIDNDTIMSLMVYNMNGSVVISQKINAQSAFISCSHLPSGIYLVKTKLGKRTVETKILKLPN